MDNLPGSPESPSAARPRRKYVRRKRPSKVELAARRANLAKAREAPKSILYRPTEKRRAASRANLQKAIAARKGPQGNAHARLNALKHGLNSKLVRESVERLGEDPKEFAAHLRRMERYYAPQDKVERDLVSVLAETVWRRLRLFLARVRWETEQLRELVDTAPQARKLSLDDSVHRADALAYLCVDYQWFFEEEGKLQAQIERALRALILKRSGGSMDYKFAAPERDPKLAALDEEWEAHEALARWMALSRREQLALLKESGATSLLQRQRGAAKAEPA